jgi:hypothetical protein
MFSIRTARGRSCCDDEESETSDCVLQTNISIKESYKNIGRAAYLCTFRGRVSSNVRKKIMLDPFLIIGK